MTKLADVPEQEIALAKINPAPYNPRIDLQPGDREYENIRRSIEHFGLVDPLIWNKRTGNLVGGHQRFKVLKGMGVERTRVRVVNLEDAEEKALNIALNKITGAWDPGKLTELLVELDTGALDTIITGFGAQEIKELVDFRAIDPEAKASGEVIAPPKNPKTKPGQIWAMGAHRLMCGDCRNADDMGRLMGGKTMNLAVTSPPYASQRKYDETSGFQPIVPDEYVAWFDDVQKNIAAALAPDGSFMLNIKEHCEEGQRHLYVKDLLISFVRAWGWRWVDEFVWVHGGTPKAVINRFKNGWESIFQFTRGDHKFRPDAVRHMSEDIPDWGGAHPSQQDGLAMSGRGDEGEGPATGGVGGKQGMGLHRGGIFERRLKKGPNAAKQQGTGTGAFGTDELTTKMGLAYPSNALSLGKNREALGHGAAFPVSLPDFFIKAYTDPGDIVFDPFMGSGTTLVAAHALDRVGYGMEISPAYCDIIVHRWESVSNKKAEVVEAGRKGGRKK